MFIPMIIAILLGLVSPSTHTNHHCNGGGTVQVSSDPNDPDGGGDDGDDDGLGGNGGDDGSGPGTGTGTGGGTGQNPPKP